MRSLLPLALALTLCSGASACELTLESGWISDAPPTARMRAGYLLIKNPGAEAVTLTAASSPGFAHVEMHETTELEGVSRMRKLDPAIVPGHGEVRFEPGGKHFMLMQPVAELTHGSRIPLSLQACGKTFSTELTVGGAEGHSGEHAQDEHDHGGHQH